MQGLITCFDIPQIYKDPLNNSISSLQCCCDPRNQHAGCDKAGIQIDEIHWHHAHARTGSIFFSPPHFDLWFGTSPERIRTPKAGPAAIPKAIHKHLGLYIPSLQIIGVVSFLNHVQPGGSLRQLAFKRNGFRV